MVADTSSAMPSSDKNTPGEFLDFVIGHKALLFGEFNTKAGRKSPYFFNSGLFQDGDALRKLCQFYAQSILDSGMEFDMLFGPAYKGIPLVAGISIALAEQGHNLPYCFNRKEAKDHGEGGNTVGAKLQGRVLIIDDVISAGTSVRESVELIRAAGAIPSGLAISLDRQEKGKGELSAVQEVERDYGIRTVAIATRLDLIGYLQRSLDVTRSDTVGDALLGVLAYSEMYGV